MIVNEGPSGARTIEGVDTAATAFIDVFSGGPIDVAVRITGLADLDRTFGGLDRRSEASYGIQQYFLNGGRIAWVVRVGADAAFDASGKLVDKPALAAALKGSNTGRTGMFALDRIDPNIFNILCLPAAALLDPSDMGDVLDQAVTYCRARRAFLIVDIPAPVISAGTSGDGISRWMEENDSRRSDHAAVYFPRLRISDPLDAGRPRDVGPSGTVAGAYARTDATRGVWKAPAGTEATIEGASPLLDLTDLESAALSELGVNTIRKVPGPGSVLWGARTLVGADQSASEWKYIPVRRTALFIEESLHQSLSWVVFEPNGEPLWAEIRRSVEVFMLGLWRVGAFQGATPRDAFFVRCDRGTTTQADIDRGIVNIRVGFAPLKPAEFVVISIQQITASARRVDPYKNFKFRLKWDGRYCAGFSRATALEGTTEVIHHREGGDASGGRKSPGRTKYEAITLERGVTHDPEFEKWANNASGMNARKDIAIEVHYEAGELALVYEIFRCWVSEFRALPDLDAGANAVAIELLRLENEGWELRRPRAPGRGARSRRS